mgnify:CR=1 FL=1
MYPKQQFKMEKAETKNVFKDFCESTSLHGYSYLFIGNSIFLKIIWTIVILLMTCVGAMFLMNNTVDYLNARLVTTIESSSAPLKVEPQNQTLTESTFLIYRVDLSNLVELFHSGKNPVNIRNSRVV